MQLVPIRRLPSLSKSHKFSRNKTTNGPFPGVSVRVSRCESGKNDAEYIQTRVRVIAFRA